MFWVGVEGKAETVAGAVEGVGAVEGAGAVEGVGAVEGAGAVDGVGVAEGAGRATGFFFFLVPLTEFTLKPPCTSNS